MRRATVLSCVLAVLIGTQPTPADDCPLVDLQWNPPATTIEVGKGFTLELRAVSTEGRTAGVGGVDVVVRYPPELQLVSWQRAVYLDSDGKRDDGLGTWLHRPPWGGLVDGELHIVVMWHWTGLPPVPLPPSSLPLITLQFAALAPGQVAIAVIPVSAEGRVKTKVTHAHDFGRLDGNLGSAVVSIVSDELAPMRSMLAALADRLSEVLGENATPVDVEWLRMAQELLAEAGH